MKIEKLTKYCLQYLEQSSDTNVMEESIDDLKNNDEFSEYMNNIEHSIYMGLVRYATSEILPICEMEFDTPNVYVTTNKEVNGKRLFHRIIEVYAIDENDNIVSNIPYYTIGKKVQLKLFKTAYKKYVVIYAPTIFDLEEYLTDEIDSIYDLELTDLNGVCVPDEMAINIKYLVFSDMKIEENPSMANYNKNYFENYLAETKANQIDNNQVEIIGRDWGDVYGN